MADTVAQDAAVVLEVRLAGDLDADGQLGASDLDILAGQLGREPIGERLAFDLDKDGRISEADLELLRRFSGPAAVGRTVAAVGVPRVLRLQPAFPNPFNASAELVYELPTAQRVELALYDALGQKVRQLVDREQEAGVYRLVWDGSDPPVGPWGPGCMRRSCAVAARPCASDSCCCGDAVGKCPAPAAGNLDTRYPVCRHFMTTCVLFRGSE